MKRFLIVMTMLLSVVLAQSSNLQNALTNLEEQSKTFLLITSVILFLAGIVPTIIGVIIYLKKLKGVEKKELLWIVVAVLFGGGGLLMLFGAIIGLVMYFLMPTLVQSLIVGGP